MGQVYVRVLFTNYREAVLARLGQFDTSQVHRYEAEALIDTGAVHCIIPPAVADHLGLLRLRRTAARYVNDQVEEVDMSEVVTIEMMGRQTSEEAMIVGTEQHDPATAMTMRMCVSSSPWSAIPLQGIARGTDEPDHREKKFRAMGTRPRPPNAETGRPEALAPREPLRLNPHLS